MRGFTTEAKVGLAVLLGAGLLVFMTFKVGGFRLREQGYRLNVVFNSTGGLDKKSPVRLAGVDIGRVEDIGLTDSKAKVLLRIRPEVHLKKGTKAAIRSTGLLGDKYTEVIPGKGPELLKDGDTIEAAPPVADIENLMGRFDSIADDIQKVTGSLREALGTEAGEQSLKEIVANIRELSRGISELVDANKEGIGKTVENLEVFSRSLRSQGDQIMTALKEITRKISSGEGTLGKLVNDDLVYTKLSRSLDDLDDSLRSVSVITKRVEQGQGTIGKLFTDDKAYDQLNSSLTALSSAVSRIERFKVDIGFRGEHQFAAGLTKGYFSVSLQPRDDKYYLVELVEDPRGRVTKTTDQVLVNGVVQNVQDVHIEQKLKFSAEFGKRVSDLGLRVGLVEDTFGLGVDYYLLDDALRLTYEAWDFNSDDPQGNRPHMKVWANYTFFRYLSASAGWDNFLNRKIATPFLGAGLKFSDDDLKYLLGAVTFIR